MESYEENYPSFGVHVAIAMVLPAVTTWPLLFPRNHFMTQLHEFHLKAGIESLFPV